MHASWSSLSAAALLLLSAPQGITAASSCRASDLKTLHSRVTQVDAFCKYFLSKSRVRSPIAEFSAKNLNNLCKCVLPKYSRPTKSGSKPAKTQAKATCKQANLGKIKAQYKEPQRFCSYYDAVDRSFEVVQAVPGLSSIDAVHNGCACYAAPATKSTAKSVAPASKTSARQKVSSPTASHIVSVEPSPSSHHASTTSKPYAAISSSSSSSHTTTKSSTTSTVSPITLSATVTAVATGSPYKQFYSGYGRTQNLDNSGNSDNAAIYTDIDGSKPIADALQQCINTAYLQINGSVYNPGTTFLSVDFHQVISNNSYVCVQYFNPCTDASTFNVLNADVGYTFGYSASGF